MQILEIDIDTDQKNKNARLETISANAINDLIIEMHSFKYRKKYKSTRRISKGFRIDIKSLNSTNY